MIEKINTMIIEVESITSEREVYFEPFWRSCAKVSKSRLIKSDLGNTFLGGFAGSGSVYGFTLDKKGRTKQTPCLFHVFANVYLPYGVRNIRIRIMAS